VKPKLKAQMGSTKPAGQGYHRHRSRGDIHDIGKDVVGFMLDVANFEVHDIGVECVLGQVRRGDPRCQARHRRDERLPHPGVRSDEGDLDAIREAGLRDHVKIMMRAPPRDEAAAVYVGADCLRGDATARRQLAKTWMEVTDKWLRCRRMTRRDKLGPLGQAIQRCFRLAGLGARRVRLRPYS